MLLLSWGHLAAIYSSAQASINNNNNNNNACNPCDPVAAYSALSHLHDHKQWEFGSLLPGESQPSSHKHCSLQAALLKAPWISSVRENLSSWAGFWDPSHMSEDTPLSTDPLGSSLTAPLLNSLFPADGYNFTPCSQSPLKGHGFQCRFRVQCHQAFCMPLPTTELCKPVVYVWNDTCHKTCPVSSSEVLLILCATWPTQTCPPRQPAPLLSPLSLPGIWMTPMPTQPSGHCTLQVSTPELLRRHGLITHPMLLQTDRWPAWNWFF